ncbi:sulfatase-like hydrolase/transferase [Crateriforma conspicua]|uniref:sulfatase-like hydrolase/transferase n=1 Tax=Crateriforma conspicua TaxID=2527996 RepID=UPI00118ADF32|nr:sulfatase-like hydrolase/transferase [Crateriforma conspicua]QDV62402.1 Choline-sulfatase [Crateriforma conspicua]
MKPFHSVSCWLVLSRPVLFGPMLSGLVLAWLACPPTAAAQPQHPNVLFIAVDDLNDWVGCLSGHPDTVTPNIDRLAGRGMLFTNAHCAAPACNPSRASIFSGRMPNVTGVWSNDSGSIQKVYPQARHLPTAFEEAGYRTAAVGKLYHTRGKEQFQQYQVESQRWSPFPAGDVKYTQTELPTKGSDHPRHMLQDSMGREVVLPINRMPSDRRPDDVAGESFDWGGFDLPDSDWGDTRATDWAIQRLTESETQPQFLCVGYYRPHIPLFAPERFFDRFATKHAALPPYRSDDLDDLSDTGRKWAIEAITAGLHSTVVKHDQWRVAVEAYLACVTYVDQEIGRLLDSVDTSPMADNTWIVLWSDHGWHLGEKDHWGKWTGWERSTRVPLIIVPPKQSAAGFAAAGSTCDAPVGLIDLYPTLVELCGLEGPQILDGHSLVPLLKKPKDEFRDSVLTMFDQDNASVRDRRWRYIRYQDGSEELYDTQTDPNEWNNLADSDQHRDAKEAMNAQLNEHLARYEADANRIAASQLKWVGVYRKQPLLPDPSEMLTHQDAEPDLNDGFQPLYNGQNLEGWKPIGGDCKFEASGNTIVGTCVPGSPSTYLCTDRSDFSDFIFSAELKHVVDGNTGVMFRAATKPGEGRSAGQLTVFGPQCEVEAYSKQRFWSGGIYGQSAGGWIYPMWLSRHESARQAMQSMGQWNRVTIQAKGDTIQTWINGQPAAKWKTDQYDQGFFGLQIHAGREGEVHFRNVIVKELSP